MAEPAVHKKLGNVACLLDMPCDCLLALFWVVSAGRGLFCGKVLGLGGSQFYDDDVVVVGYTHNLESISCHFCVPLPHPPCLPNCQGPVSRRRGGLGIAAESERALQGQRCLTGGKLSWPVRRARGAGRDASRKGSVACPACRHMIHAAVLQGESTV